MRIRAHHDPHFYGVPRRLYTEDERQLGHSVRTEGACISVYSPGIRGLVSSWVNSLMEENKR
jgi:hypothetical protein